MIKRILLGKLNGTEYVNAWEIPEGMGIPKSGSYAIVENRNDYDLVKVMGTFATDEKYAKFLTNGNKLKKVVKFVPRTEVRDD